MIRTIFLALAAATFCATGALAEPIFPKAGGVGLEPPPGMTQAKGFLGFEKTPASIVITELPPEAYQQIDADRDKFGAKIANARIGDFAVGGNSGFIIRGQQAVPGGTYRKWVVIVGTPKETALVTAQVPEGDKDISDAAVEAALKTIVFRDPPALSAQMDALPFRVGDLVGFRPVKTLAGTGLVLTEGPKDTDKFGEQPNIVIATSLAHPPPPDGRLDYAKQVLQSLSAIQIKDIGAAKLVDVGGTQWAEIHATGTEGIEQTPVDVSFFLRFAAAESILVIGSAPKALAKPDLADRFKKLALSVAPKG